MKYPYNNFYEVLERNAKEYGRKVAYFIDKDKITWREVKRKVDTFARSLELLGVKKYDKVPIYVGNSLEYVIAFLGIQKIGAVPVPINTFLKEDEIAFIVNDVEAEIMVASSKFACNIKNIREKTSIKKIIWEGEPEKIDEDNISFKEILANIEPHEVIEPPSLEDLAVIIYTSGTTGKPKGAMLTYKNIFADILGINEIVKITPKDRFIAYLPMFHSFTLTVNILLPLYVGAGVVIIKSIMPFSNIIKQNLFRGVSIFR